MKRISFFLVAAICFLPATAPAQDPAVQERLNVLSAQIQDLIDARDAQNKRLEDLARQLRQLQDQQSQVNTNYASEDELRQLAAKLQEIDQKRRADNDHIIKELESLRRALSSPVPKSVAAPAPAPGGGAIPDQGYNYVIQSGDTLSAIVRAYRDKGIKVSVEQILKANPGLKADRLHVGEKIFIPAPQP